MQTISCQVLSAGQRRLTFNPQYAGVNGAPISFSVVNELAPTTESGPLQSGPVHRQSGRYPAGGAEWSEQQLCLQLAVGLQQLRRPTPRPRWPIRCHPSRLRWVWATRSSLANVFTDAETPNQLTLSVSGSASGAEFQSAFNHLGHALDERGERR